ncbi:hypothetical protein [Aurantiacibacter gilvus]|uniref:Lipoprotein n=1 Tax=Aurantiacibacter gilvus TaxID=3139141 RepID=A0ABU9IE01_9SPHN
MKSKLFTRFALLGALATSVSACAVIPDTPIVNNGPAARAGTAVALSQPVWTGRVVVTPIEVHEDSRCPINARCVWAGRAIVLTRIDGAGWREQAYLTLGEPHEIRNTSVTLTSLEPGRTTDGPVRSADYRFTYEGGN